MCVVVLALPFSVTGSRFLLAQVSRVAPVSLEHEAGALMGDLKLSAFTVALSGVEIVARDVTLQLNSACLWRSEVCLNHLRAGKVSVTVESAAPDSMAEEPYGGTIVAPQPLFRFPFPVNIDQLEFSEITVDWPGGNWVNGEASAALLLSESNIELSSAKINAGQLTLAADDESTTIEKAITLPELSLPLQLIVNGLVLQQPAWSIADSYHTHEIVTLTGRWQREQVVIEEVSVASENWGGLAISGQMAMAGDWPVTANIGVDVAEPPMWSHLHGRELAVDLAGSLAELEIIGRSPGPQVLAATATIRLLSPRLPFQLEAQASWVDELNPSSLPDFPAEDVGAVLISPLTISAKGSLDTQLFELQASMRGPEFAEVRIGAQGSHQSGSLTLDSATLADEITGQQLALQGWLEYGDHYDFKVVANSSGIDLPSFSERLAGSLQGALTAEGRVDDSGWVLGLNDIDLKGDINGLPAFVRGSYALSSSRLLTAGRLDGALNGALLKLRTEASGADSGTLLLTLDDLSRWQAGTRGKVELEATLSGDSDRLRLRGSVENVAWENVRSPRVDVEFDALLTGNTPFTGLLSLSELNMGDRSLDRLELAVRGDMETQRIVIDLQGDIDGQIMVRGQRAGADWWGRIEPASLDSVLGAWKLSDPVGLAWVSDKATLNVLAHCWRGPEVRLCSRDALILGPSGNIDASLAGDIGFIANFFPAGMETSGTIAATLASSWSPDIEPEFLINAELHDGRFTRHYSDEESATVAWDKVTAQVRREAFGLVLHADLRRDDAGSLSLKLNLPGQRTDAMTGELELTDLRLAAMRPFLPSLASLEGVLTGRVKLAGTMDEPSGTGRLRLSRGAMAMHGNPTALTDLDLDIVLTGDRAAISGAGLFGGGELSLNGDLLLQQPELRLAISGKRNKLLLPPGSEAEISQELQLVFSHGFLDLDGDIIVHEGRMEPDRLPEGSVDVSTDVVEVDYAGNVLKEQRPFDMQLNVRVKIRDQFRVHAREIDSVVGGDLRLQQERGRPLQLFGSLNVVGGEVRAYGQRLQIKQGSVAFVGDPGNPELNLRAERDITLEQVRVGVSVQGTAEEPVLQVYSDPAMPQTEALSYLVRGRGLDSGAGADGTAVALSLGTGVVNQSGVMSGINSIPGISNVEFGSDGTADDTAATLGGFIGERIYLSYGVGLYEPINVLTARFYLQTRLWLEVVSRLENSIDLYYSFDIN